MSALVPAAVVAAAVYALIPPAITTIIVLIAAGLGISGSALGRVRSLAFTLLVCSVGAVLGLGSRAAVGYSQQQSPALPSDQISRLSGFVSGNSQRTEDGWQIDMRVTEITMENLRTSADLDVTLSIYDTARVMNGEDGGSGGATNLKTGEEIPPGASIEAEVAGLFPGRAGVWYASAVHMTVGEPPLSGLIRARAYRSLARGIERSAGSGAPLLKALLLGERTDLTVRTEELFRRAGVSHVLALSGMHLAIVAALVVALVLPLFGRRVALIAGAVVALAYTLFIGARPSLVRATVMCEIMLILMLFERPLHLVEVVAAAFLVHLLLQPAAISEVSFQLSYLALLGISVIAPGLMREMRPWIPTAIVAPLAAGVGAQVAGAPVLFRTFGRIYPIGVVAGAVLGPLVALFMTAGIIGIAVSMIPVPSLAGVSSRILSAMASIIESIAWWFAGAPAVLGESLAAPAVALSVVCLGGGIVVERRRLLWTGRR